MKVSIKDLSVDMDIKNKGIELDVYDNDDKHLGDLIVTKTGLTWCNGRVKRENGHKISWTQFIAMVGEAANKPAKVAGSKRASPAKTAESAVVSPVVRKRTKRPTP